MNDTQPAKEWPNRGSELIATATTMAVLSTLVATWRVIVRFRIHPWLGLSDWLMIGGVILNFTSCIPFAIFAAHGGQGRLMADPWWLIPGHTSYELRIIFITQCLNVYAMFLVKASICAYLMALDFGPSYRVIIWISVAIVVSCNFIMMLILHFAYCRPYWSRWDFSVQGKCWPDAVSEVTAYLQIVSNIVTDLIYAAAPIVYLRHVQLSKRTQWGVRIVFLLALIANPNPQSGTALSIAKIPTTYKFLRSKELMWDAVDLSICSVNEVCVGIIIANLPPLRKTLNGLLSKVLPASLTGNSGNASRKMNSRAITISTKGHNKLADNGDGDSERYILELEEQRPSQIMKTTRVDVDGLSQRSGK
ncbi:hypothetical protein J1614_003855 [Plenodomus biglobosus]|nr:hypothetical protein J1614_003855 [Plenodomus biglobosus]